MDKICFSFGIFQLEKRISVCSAKTKSSNDASDSNGGVKLGITAQFNLTLAPYLYGIPT